MKQYLETVPSGTIGERGFLDLAACFPAVKDSLKSAWRFVSWNRGRPVEPTAYQRGMECWAVVTTDKATNRETYKDFETFAQAYKYSQRFWLADIEAPLFETKSNTEGMPDWALTRIKYRGVQAEPWKRMMRVYKLTHPFGL